MNALKSSVLAVLALSCAQVAMAEDPPVYVLQWGSFGTGDGEFSYPEGLAVNSDGEVFVADRGNHRIQKFDNNGGFLLKWGGLGTNDGEFSSPSGIAIDGAGTLFVADDDNDRIQKFDGNGGFLGKWGTSGAGAGQFQGAKNVAVSSAGHVFVIDFGNNRIQKFESDGTYLTQWSVQAGGLGNPRGIAVDTDENVYVSDWNYLRIEKYTGNGVFLLQWGSYGSSDGQFNQPAHIASDGVNDLYVADAPGMSVPGNNRIQKFDAIGIFKTKWGSPGVGDGEFQAPWGVAVDAVGNVFVGEYYGNRIQKFSPPGVQSVSTTWGRVKAGRR